MKPSIPTLQANGRVASFPDSAASPLTTRRSPGDLASRRADARVHKSSGRQPCRPGQRRPGQPPSRLWLRTLRHADDDARLPAAGIHRQADDHVLVDHQSYTRRICTDGRDWPTKEMGPTYAGYSIGRWIDEDGDGKYDVLLVETRGPSRDLVSMMAPACHCIMTTNRSSKSASISTRQIPTYFITRLP
jgi:hypothetical protein